MTHQYRMLIAGKMADASSMLDVIDPATEAVFATAPIAGKEHLDAAVSAARAAFEQWRKTSIKQRRKVLSQMAQALNDNIDHLAAILVSEQGKPIASARVEIMVAAIWCEAARDWELPNEVVESDAEREVETIRTPLGVVGAIVPWNFPVGLAFWKIAPALFTGNCVIVKPAPSTPLTTLEIGKILCDIVPAGVLNVLSGGDELGHWMTEHPGIDKISFTGSTETGKKVMATAADTLKRITLELGGNDPAIIFDDVDVEHTAREIFWAAFRNSGQFCIAAKRIYVQDTIYDQFAKALARIVRVTKVGPGQNPDSELGPIQNKAQFERVKSLIDRTKAAGHKILVEGPVPKGAGYFIPTTVVDNPPDDSEVVEVEAFGPVVPLLAFSTPDDAIRRANASSFGLAASIWTNNEKLAKEVAAQLDCGTVWINEVHHLSPYAPFGGHKQSGIGVENGREGLLEFTNSKTLSIKKRPASK